MARPLSLVISKEPDTPSLDCRSGQALSSISCAISIPIETPLSCALPRRTRVAIASKAREIGLVPPLRIWSNEEAAQLRRVYRTGISIDALVEMSPGRSKIGRAHV